MRSKDRSLMTEISQFVMDYSAANGIAPTMQEVADGVGVSKATAYRYIKQMQEEGVISSNGYRTTAVVKSIAKKVRVPIVGSIACGAPMFAEENIEEYISLPVSLFGTGNFFILHAEGDSMINAGIANGDLVLVRQQNTADDGQIVVALIGDEATLKRFYRDKKHRRYRLHPENETMEDIYVKECEIQGVAVHVIKSLE